MGIDDAITQTIIGTGASCGMHESQSRFFENMVGRSREFWEPIYGRLQDTFKEQLGGISLDQFIKAVNKAVPGPIRTEADELTYSLHILIRYELEKEIFEDKISIRDLPLRWREKYKEYLGLEPENDTEGILQDIHWANGSFGYFPSYALGTAISAQIYFYMEACMPVKEYLREGRIKPITDFLKDHVHKYGKMKTTNQILKEMTGEEFNPDYYIPVSYTHLDVYKRQLSDFVMRELFYHVCQYFDADC